MSRARPMAKPVVKLSQAEMYDIIRRPVVTEKSTLGSQHNQITFRVPLDATKPQIKAAVEGVFKVKVTPVPHSADWFLGVANLRGQLNGVVDLASFLGLARRSPRPVDLDALVTATWGEVAEGGSEQVKHHVWALRRKLEADPGNPRHLVTVRGVGYRLQ